MNETWRPALGLESFYEVSDLGRVRSFPRTVNTRGGATRVVPARVLKSASTEKGYLRVRLYPPGSGSTHPIVRTVHRLVLEAFIGPRPDGLQCCHNNGNPADNRLSNLRWDSASENTYDTVRHGTHPQARKTHCRRNHPYDAVNTHIKPSGERCCRSCQTKEGAV